MVRVAQGRLSGCHHKARRNSLVVVLGEILGLELNALGLGDDALPVSDPQFDLILGREQAVRPLDLLELVLDLGLRLGQSARPLRERFDLGFNQDAIVDRVIDDIADTEERERPGKNRQSNSGQG